jgi:hypothetical protein
MARRHVRPPAARLSTADYLRELRAGLHAPATSVELEDETSDVMGALLSGRGDVERVIEIRDADARNATRSTR